MAASAFAVESANVVGYTTQAVTADTYYMIGVQFQTVGGNTSEIGLNDLVKLNGIAAAAYTDMDTSAAKILVNTASGYDFYYYLSDAYDSNGDEVTGWADGTGDLADGTMALGDGFWFIAPVVGSSASISVKGEVTKVVNPVVSFGAGWSIIANPFPVDTSLANVTTSGLVAVGYSEMDTAAAQILVNTASGYDFYYYLSDAYDSNGDEVTAWADGTGDACSGTQVSAGEGFWMKAPAAGSLTFALQ
ncbi:MAG: hypothetical protein IK084_02765 [Bacteroidaceae bacterium]|nr:hypothetical protein [Bacteroidaceae bacterium]